MPSGLPHLITSIKSASLSNDLNLYKQMIGTEAVHLTVKEPVQSIIKFTVMRHDAYKCVTMHIGLHMSLT